MSVSAIASGASLASLDLLRPSAVSPSRPRSSSCRCSPWASFAVSSTRGPSSAIVQNFATS
eukprot:10406792-Heterocapsa_arctica.AAC.1